MNNKDYKLNLLHVAVMIPTNFNVVECVKVLIKNCVDPNSKALVITHEYLLFDNCLCNNLIIFSQH